MFVAIRRCLSARYRSRVRAPLQRRRTQWKRRSRPSSLVASCSALPVASRRSPLRGRCRASHLGSRPKLPRSHPTTAKRSPSPMVSGTLPRKPPSPPSSRRSRRFSRTSPSNRKSSPGPTTGPSSRPGVAGGETFDVFWINSASLPVYASAGALLPIDSIVGGDGGVDLANFAAPLVEMYQWDGHQYGIPRDFDTIALFYQQGHLRCRRRRLSGRHLDLGNLPLRLRAAHRCRRGHLGRGSANELAGELLQLHLPEWRPRC